MCGHMCNAPVRGFPPQWLGFTDDHGLPAVADSEGVVAIRCGKDVCYCHSKKASRATRRTAAIESPMRPDFHG